jgi:hypothetical protein
VAAARAPYRRALAETFERLICAAIDAGHLPIQEVRLSAAALIGALTEASLGPLAPAPPADPALGHAHVQALTLLALRALGVPDARARGLVVQTPVPNN